MTQSNSITPISKPDYNDNTVSHAQLSWKKDEQGILVPVSEMFGDVYYSLADGLAESRYVFIEQNDLPNRFRLLIEDSINNNQYQCFTIAELGFGTGLNVLATWQLWDNIKTELIELDQSKQSANQVTQYLRSRLHIISTEKFPLKYEDLLQSLNNWLKREPSLAPFIAKLLALYPSLVAGCHRLHLADDVTLDLWLGDAAESLTKLDNTLHSPIDSTISNRPAQNKPSYQSHQPYINAWFLDGFAPSRNESLWAEQIFAQIKRLSKPDTTVATFSSAGVVKRGLRGAGFKVKKVKGFGHKREMLTARIEDDNLSEFSNDANSANSSNDANPSISHVAVIGSGVSGLMTAWVLAKRGIKITLLDKSAPLAGGSGNPRALLAPKMTPLKHVDEHLHSMGYLYSQRFYHQLDAQNEQADSESSLIFENTATLDLMLKSNINCEQVAEYPESIATTLTHFKAQEKSGLTKQDLHDNLYLPQAGLVNPKALADTALNHPLIDFVQAEVVEIIPNVSDKDSDITTVVCLNLASSAIDKLVADAVVIATAHASQSLDSRIFEFRKIRGQLSWFEPTAEQLEALPKLPLKYGGYCSLFTPADTDDKLNPVTPNTPTFLLGASFVRNDTDTAIRTAEHATNREKLITAIPELADSIDTDNFKGWQARVGIRAQTPDYHPLVGQVDEAGKIWTLSGMGSKGYAFAPMCAQVLADMMTGQFAPMPSKLLAKLSPHRKVLQKPLN